MTSPFGWGWTSGGTADVAGTLEAARAAAARHAVPGTAVTVEFLLHAEEPSRTPVGYTGFGYRGVIRPSGGIDWTAASDITDAPKPACADLGVDPAACDWRACGPPGGAMEAAFPAVRFCRPGDWVLVRDSGGTVAVYDRAEWSAYGFTAPEGTTELAVTA